MSKNLKTIAVILSLMSAVFGQVLYNVSGTVLLEDSVGVGTHEGVKIKFYNLPSMVVEDSILSQNSGAYSINVSPGYYLVEWTRAGYVPWELGGLSLATNTVLNQVTLIPGEVLEVSGDVSGTWTTSFVYYVVGDITVPGGQTLTINPGVRVKFAANTNLTCNGVLNALGTADEHVLFTSKEPTPLPGDWGNITLNTGNNTLTYVDYEWASDGINGSNVTGTTIDHITINGTLSLTASGLYFSSGTDLTLTNNYIAVAGENGIYAQDAYNSDISFNTIITPSNGVRVNSCQSCTINENEITTGDNITGPDTAIYAPNSNFVQIIENVIVADQYGIYSDNSYKSVINNNHLTGSIFWCGIQFTNSDSSLVSQNSISRTVSNGNTSSWQYLLNGSNSEGSIIRRDTLISNDFPDINGFNLAISCEWSLVDSNYINFNHSYAYGNYTIYDSRNSNILNNEIYATTDHWGTQHLIHSNSEGSYINRIEGNRIKYNNLGQSGFSYIIWTQNNTIIRNNSIEGDKLERAIYVQNNSVVDSNTISGNFNQQGVIYIAGDTVSVHENTMTQTGSGTVVYSQGHNVVSIYDNDFDIANAARWISFDNTEAEVHHNIVDLNSGRGVEFYNQSGGSIYNNTILSSGTGDYGVFLTNQTAVPIYNNIVQGFQNGIYAENTIQNYNLDHNNLYDIAGSLFSGSAIPPLAGQMIDQNANGDASDIYANISFDPQFVGAANDNYDLLITSPCINAGTDNLTDPDGTISDIGANYHFIYIVIDHTENQSTIDVAGPYVIEAQIVSTIQATLVPSLYYSIDGGTSYASESMISGANDTWHANIPGQALNTTIKYYIEVDDGTHTVTAPFNIENEVYSFFITLFSEFANLGGSSDTFGDIDLAWSTPVPMVGTLEGLKLYRSMSPNVSITPGNLYQEFSTDITSFTDSNVDEGDTYYYRMTGLVAQGTDTTESVVSSEIGVLSNDATVVRVRGVAYLENKSDHSGTKVYFEKTSPSAVTDSVYTNTEGYYDIVLVTGIYNAHFTQDGYQPRLLGHQFFSGNAYLDTLILVPGGVVSLSGNVNGTFTSNNLYFVDGNISIPNGDSLVIEAGTQVLFRGNYTITANGPLFVNGNANNRVIFSSRMPVPAVGDWGTITLNSGATGSEIKYAEYRYASDGFICNNVNQLTIWGCTVNTLSINARAITLNNCENVDIRYNTLSTPGDWVIYKPQDEWDNSGVFIDNTINAANNGMYIRRFHNLQIDSNQVHITGTGIQTDYSQNMLCRDNYIDGMHSIGFYANNCDGAVFTRNHVRFSGDYGYYVPQTDNISFNENTFFFSGSNNWVIGVYGGGNSYNSVYENNSITFSDSLGQSSEWYGFRNLESSTFRNNRIISWTSGGGHHGGFSYANNSLFENNYVYLRSNGGDQWNRAAFSGSGNTSLNDTLTLGNSTQGYMGSNWIINGASIDVPNSNNSYLAIECTGGVLEVDNVTISNSCYGIYGTGVGGHIKNTLIDVYASSYGVKIENNSTMSLYKNTITGNSAGTGIWSETNATVVTNSNIVDGFATGMLANSQNTVQTSLFSNNTINFSGTDLPPQVGDVVTVNSNADPSDIYGNIFLDPEFVNPDTGNYALQSTSPAINAGDIDSLDLDGTIADIGVYFFNFGYVPMDMVADSTGSGYVALSWDIISSDSIQHYIPYYKLESSGTWLTANTTTNSHTIISGLTNNQPYHFAVSVQYPVHESDRSATLTEKPGLSQLVLSTNYIVSYRDVGETVIESFDMSNPGNRDLVWSLGGTGSFDLTSGSVSPDATITIHDTLVSYSSQVSPGVVLINSNDPEHFLDAIGILNVVGNYAAVPVDHFSPLIVGEESYWVALSSALLDGSSLQSGDEIAIYDDDACVGAGMMTGSYPYVIQCFGYTAGDTLQVRIYDYDQAREIETDFTIVAGTFVYPAGSATAFAYGNISASAYRTQIVELNHNIFNLVSVYDYPRYPDMWNVFGSTMDSLEIVYNDQGNAYIPNYGINTISNYNLVDGYHVFARDQNPEMHVSGLAINPADYPITIQPSRFNSIAYLNNAVMPVVDAFAAISSSIEIVQDDAGGVYIPGLAVNTIGNMLPGKGYQVFSSETGDITLTYPESTGEPLSKYAENTPVTQFSKPEYFQSVPATGLPYTVIISDLFLDGHKSDELHGEIAVYDGSECVGVSSFGTFPVVVTTWGGSQDYELTGFENGNEILYRVYIEEYNREIEIDANGQVFGEGAYSMVRLTAEPGIIPQDFYLAENYPNPFNPQTTISYGLEDVSDVRLVVYDLRGREVWSKHMGQQIPGHYKVLWSGLDNDQMLVASGVYIYRIIAGDQFTAVRKMVLIR